MLVMQNEFPINLLGQFVAAIGVFIQHCDVSQFSVGLPGTGKPFVSMQQSAIRNVALGVFSPQAGANHGRFRLDRHSEQADLVTGVLQFLNRLDTLRLVAKRDIKHHVETAGDRLCLDSL